MPNPTLGATSGASLIPVAGLIGPMAGAGEVRVQNLSTTAMFLATNGQPITLVGGLPAPGFRGYLLGSRQTATVRVHAPNGAQPAIAAVHYGGTPQTLRVLPANGSQPADPNRWAFVSVPSGASTVPLDGILGRVGPGRTVGVLPVVNGDVIAARGDGTAPASATDPNGYSSDNDSEPWVQVNHTPGGVPTLNVYAGGAMPIAVWPKA